jgi:ribonuclease P protein component
LTWQRVRGCNSALFSRRTPDETNLPAIEDTAQAHSRLSRAHAHPRRPEGDTRPPRQGARTALRLSGPGATLPRGARLLARAQYEAALAGEPARARRHFTLFVRPNGEAHARLGIIASKRVAARAVDRNRAKRLVREAFRKMRHRLGGVDVVVRLRRCPGKGRDAAVEISRLLEELSAKGHPGQPPLLQ